ncbi:hypothetical protein AB0J86_08790 [Micromonospora sp. NPDC049559]|uniref:hypothetical protein n=1 Tax=Micromonospora sp. NPDC049559 TaxID=3155923 RepID=UPI00341776D7
MSWRPKPATRLGGARSRAGHADRSYGHDLCDALIAGAVGTETLNVATYLDMAVRGRPSSSAPEESVRKITGVLHLRLGPEDRAANRRSALGALLGYGVGVSVPVVLTLLVGPRRVPLPVAAGLLGAGTMLATDAGLAALRVSDPRSWSGADWLSDAVPHLAYGFAAALTLRRLGLIRRIWT